MSEGQYDPTPVEKHFGGQKCVGTPSRSDARHLIDQLINYHAAQQRQFAALRHALPGEMSPQAEQALYELVLAALQRLR